MWSALSSHERRTCAADSLRRFPFAALRPISSYSTASSRIAASVDRSLLTDDGLSGADWTMAPCALRDPWPAGSPPRSPCDISRSQEVGMLMLR